MSTLKVDVDTHKGKVVDRIESDSIGSGLVMAENVKIFFTDGSSIILKIDWRGHDAYISQALK